MRVDYLCPSMYLRFIKPAMDRVAAAMALVILSPVLLFIVLILWFEFGKKIFFIQNRTGLHGKIFRLIKFRTMTDQRDSRGILLPDKERITRTGTFLRKTSLDELPQLINILKGDMSLVGPRPLLPEYLPLYNEMQKRRLHVKPGITGWAQVNGRNRTSWEERFALDVWYVDHLSFLLDIRIIFITVVKVLRSEGIDHSATVTMEPFRGTN